MLLTFAKGIALRSGISSGRLFRQTPIPRNLLDQKRARAGFSLVEVMVATGILGVIISALLGFFVNAIALNEISRSQTAAISHAQYVLEGIRTTTFANVSTQIAGGVWTWDTAAVTAQGLSALKNEAVTTTSSGTTLLTVTVTVSWNQASGRARSIAVTTLMGGV